MADIYAFGPFLLRCPERQLHRGANSVTLGSRPFSVLLALVERAGALVPKGELISLVWGDAIVGDNTLHAHIGALRRLLGDEAIATKQGRGYRFTLPVRQMAEEGFDVGHGPGGGPPDAMAQVTPDGLVGRGAHIRAVADRLAASRLVTLRGPGGVGKTRLMLAVGTHVAARFRNGACIVELATLSDPELMPSHVAACIGAEPRGGDVTIELLARQLSGRKILLLLDNCEHVLAAAAALVEALLGAAPDLHILATSREALSCLDEQVFEVPPLTVPEPDENDEARLREAAAVTLFLQRAQAADSRFVVSAADLPLVGAICRSLDGLPLAIEMIAHLAPTLGLDALAARLDDAMARWPAPRQSVPHRQRTLTATFLWSYGLLTETEQSVLRRVAVFQDPFPLAAAEAVAAAPGLDADSVVQAVTALVRKSMLAIVPHARQPRYRLLQTTRALALERLSVSGEAAETYGRHAEFVLAMAERAHEAWEVTADQAWLAEYQPWLNDLRAALDWSMECRGGEVICVALAGASWPLWRELGLRVEGRRRLAAACAFAEAAPPSQQARLHVGLGDMLVNSAVLQAASEAERAVALYRTIDEPALLGRALALHAYCVAAQGQLAAAAAAAAEAQTLLEGRFRRKALATTYNVLARIEHAHGRTAEAMAALETANMLFGLAGAERAARSGEANLMDMYLAAGDTLRAIAIGRDLAAQLRASRHGTILGTVLGNLTAAYALSGDVCEAMAAAREAAPLLRQTGQLHWLCDYLALCCSLAGRPQEGALLAGYADAQYGRVRSTRQNNEMEAIRRLTRRLEGQLGGAELARLRRQGACLTEDEALEMALAPVAMRRPAAAHTQTGALASA